MTEDTSSRSIWVVRESCRIESWACSWGIASEDSAAFVKFIVACSDVELEAKTGLSAVL